MPASAVTLRRAEATEAARLSAVARSSKAHWSYSERQLDLWSEDLRISADQLASCPAFVAELDGELAGVYLLDDFSTADASCCLEHFWVLPAFMGRGVGRAMLDHARRVAAARGAHRIEIDADPNAEAFYLACGAERLGAVPAPIDADPARERPQLRLAS